MDGESPCSRFGGSRSRCFNGAVHRSGRRVLGLPPTQSARMTPLQRSRPPKWTERLSRRLRLLGMSFASTEPSTEVDGEEEWGLGSGGVRVASTEPSTEVDGEELLSLLATIYLYASTEPSTEVDGELALKRTPSASTTLQRSRPPKWTERTPVLGAATATSLLQRSRPPKWTESADQDHEFYPTTGGFNGAVHRSGRRGTNSGRCPAGS